MNGRRSPILAPGPSRNGTSKRGSIPPRLDSTMPDRRLATRTPAALAGAVAVSQSRTSMARKAAAFGRFLVDRLVAGIAVPADGRACDEHRRRLGHGEHRAYDRAGSVDLAGTQFLLASRGPAAAGYRRAGEVHDGVDAVKRALAQASVGGARVPPQLLLAGRAPADPPGD